jgi:hypothetical protein
MIPPRHLDKSQRRGTATHDITAAIDMGEIPDCDIDKDIYDDVMYMVEGYEKFKKDYQPEILGIEQMVHDGKLYAGTYDRRLRLNGERIMELKCTAGVGDTHGLQGVFYSSAAGLSDPPLVLRLTKDAKYFLWEVDKYIQLFTLSRSLIELYHNWYKLPSTERRGLTKVKGRK